MRSGPTRGVSRRSLLAGALGLTVAAPLAGCGQPTVNRLSFLNWQDYIDPTLLTDFTQQSGYQIGYETYASNDALRQRMLGAAVTRKGGRKSFTFDLIVPSGDLFRELREGGYLQELDTSVVTPALLGNLTEAMRAVDVDPGNRFSIPWATGTTGIGYDTTVFKEPPTWKVFLDPAYQGRMSLLAETREAFSAAYFSLGADPNSSDPAAISAAEKQLTAMKANATFNADTYLDDLADGKLVVAQAFSTDLLQARKRNPKLAYVLPPEGATRWVDLLCIPAGAPNPKAANEMAAFYLDPRVSATNAIYNLVATGNLAARQFVPPELVADPAIYPPAEKLDSLVFLRDLGKQVDDLYAAAWKRLTSR